MSKSFTLIALYRELFPSRKESLAEKLAALSLEFKTSCQGEVQQMTLGDLDFDSLTELELKLKDVLRPQETAAFLILKHFWCETYEFCVVTNSRPWRYLQSDKADPPNPMNVPVGEHLSYYVGLLNGDGEMLKRHLRKELSFDSRLSASFEEKFVNIENPSN